ncbi:MAG: RagB/SusD family nutrient uptake outer membrane protein [Dysgonamonadaceae bacterium]|jgi:hypothetical protein|nr:RagB/SusD family nutrient uptake outer membrane protein [Dysgonamonadaceae bacterium]
MKKILNTIMTVIACSVLFQNCSLEPEVSSFLTPEQYYDSRYITKDKILARYSAPIRYWSDQYGTVPYVSYSTLSAWTTDEMVMPTRSVATQDWYDGGVYMCQWDHSFPAEREGTSWHNSWFSMERGVSEAWTVLSEFENEVDFEAAGLTEADRASMIGQMQVLIANNYLEGLNAFGGVPLYKEKPEVLVPRSTDKETFDYIEELLRKALPGLPQRKENESNTGTITQGVAASLLARLYFNAKPYIKEDRTEQCIAICDSILQGKFGYYELAPDYRDIFGFDNEKCNELVWAVPSEHGKREFEAGVAKYGTHYGTSSYLDNLNFSSWNGYCITPSLDKDGKNYRYETGKLGGPFKLGCPYDKFEDTDVRKHNYVYHGAIPNTTDPNHELVGNKNYYGMFLAGILTNPITGKSCTSDGSRDYAPRAIIPMEDKIAQLHPTKYNSTPGGGKEGALYAEENSGVRLMKYQPVPNLADNAKRFNPDVPVIRLTEIQYTLAECYFNKGNKTEAARLINDIRKRYFTGSSDPNPVPDEFDKYRLADEWLIEFIGEGRRRTDLVRWDMYTTESWWDHQADNDPDRNRMPIPKKALQANPLIKQNPGYGY